MIVDVNERLTDVAEEFEIPAEGSVAPTAFNLAALMAMFQERLVNKSNRLDDRKNKFS